MPPLVAAKKPLAELVLSVSVSGAPVFVVALPYWSSSRRLSATAVVFDAVAVIGAGEMATWVGVPAVIVTVVVPQEVAPFLAVMVGLAAVSSP